MLKFYQCKVCGVNCAGLPFDGELYKKEVCCENHLVLLGIADQQAAEANPDKKFTEHLHKIVDDLF